MNAEIIIFIGYFVALLIFSLVFFFNGSNKNEEDFFLGGRSMGPWITALSAQASVESAWLLMGLPGSILAFGFGKIWIGIGCLLGTIANWIICAKRMRKFSKAADNAITLPQYLTNRFGYKKGPLQVACACIFLVAFTIYVSSALVAGSTIVTSLIPGLNEQVAMIIFLVFLVGYTFLGGFKAVCWTDFFQGILMLVALLAIPIVVVCTTNLDTSTLSQVYTYTDASTGELVTCNFGTSLFSCSAADIISGLAWGLGYFGMPHVVVRFMSIRKPSMVKKSAIVAIVWIVLAIGAACLLGYLGRMVVGESLLADGSQKMVFIAMARMFFPAAASGLLLAAIMAASVSTADSQLLVASSSFTSDIYHPLIRPKAKDKELLWVGRIVVVILAIVAFFIASAKGSGAQAIMDMVENAWGIFGSAFGPIIILSLFWRRLNYQGACCGIIIGALVDIAWGIFMGSTGIYELLPGFIACFATAVIVSLLTKEPSKKALEIFDKATASDYEED